MNTKKTAALAGFIVLGLSPSFVDWEQSPDKRKSMIMFYSIGVLLIYFGLFSGKVNANY